MEDDDANTVFTQLVGRSGRSAEVFPYAIQLGAPPICEHAGVDVLQSSTLLCLAVTICQVEVDEFVSWFEDGRLENVVASVKTREIPPLPPESPPELGQALVVGEMAMVIKWECLACRREA